MVVTTNWAGALAFDAVADTGHTLRIDTSVEGGGLGTGMNPKKMLLASISGCSGMDVVDILRKGKVAFNKLEIVAEAEQTDTHPKIFKFIKMIYRIDAEEMDLEKVKRAVALSHEKYCGVSAMLSKACEVSYTVELL